MRVSDGASREFAILHLPIKVLYVSGRKLFELDVPDSWDYVASYLALVGGVSAGLDASSDAIIEPPS